MPKSPVISQFTLARFLSDPRSAYTGFELWCLLSHGVFGDSDSYFVCLHFSQLVLFSDVYEGSMQAPLKNELCAPPPFPQFSAVVYVPGRYQPSSANH